MDLPRQGHVGYGAAEKGESNDDGDGESEGDAKEREMMGERWKGEREEKREGEMRK